MAKRPGRSPLLLPELFHHILDYLDVPTPVTQIEQHVTGIKVHEPSPAARQAFLALAQTCHALSGPSLDRLWRSLGSLVPLIQCFAEVVDTERIVVPPSAAEWAVIRRYAVRVRELCITETPQSTLSLYLLLPALLFHRSNATPFGLLPNLKVLVWKTSADPYLVRLVKKLFTPGLVSLDIALYEGMDMLRPLFDDLALFCPNIKTLKCDLGRPLRIPTLRAVDALSNPVNRLGNIERLEIFEPFDAITLKRIILSPHFKALGIMLGFLLEVEQIDITPTDTPFPDVQTVDLELWDLGFLTSLLRPHQQRFHSIGLRFHSDGYRPRVQPMLSCFTALATPQRTNTVQSIVFSLHGDCLHEYWQEVSELVDSPERFCLTYGTLSPLASFRCLRKLVIALNNQISINDDELGTLARSWPSMEVLQLNCRSGGWPWETADYPTLFGLLAVIVACPQLRNICLPVDARVVPKDASPYVRNTVIPTIDFPDSLINEPLAVVEFLHKHLPGVRSVSAFAPVWGYALWAGDMTRLTECQQMWDEVDELLDMYATEEF